MIARFLALWTVHALNRFSDDEELHHANTPPNELSSQHCRHSLQIAVHSTPNDRMDSTTPLAQSELEWPAISFLCWIEGELHRSSTDPTKHISRYSTLLCRHALALLLLSSSLESIKFGSEEALGSDDAEAVVYRSLVAALKCHRTLDDSLEAKSEKFLRSVNPKNQKTADAFVDSLAPSSDDSSSVFVESFLELISTPSQAMTTAAVVMLRALMLRCSLKIVLSLVNADLIPQLIVTLNPRSHSFAEAVDIHIFLIKSINDSLHLPTPDGLAELGIEDGDERQAVHGTVLKHVLFPSEKYIWHLCVNRFSIIDSEQSEEFLDFLALLLTICPSYQPTMDFVLHMPVALTIPSCLTFFEADDSIWSFLFHMNNTQREWNDTKGDEQQMWKTVDRVLRMEGVEDVIEEKLRNDESGIRGRSIVVRSMEWNDLLGMNLS
ncbi:hypothetical protein BLNAU_4924 [Blattamonas nauphoetae]|uniref:Uncharacterized protein n=1 Tax=Blattamonas nauphoetae TaxID=2049346 RepID=A0ABQ9Y8E8_9EUKA|nr:hypothetical protein BLNAU_4924 [Blattamonas nauphoetae]